MLISREPYVPQGWLRCQNDRQTKDYAHDQSDEGYYFQLPRSPMFYQALVFSKTCQNFDFQTQKFKMAVFARFRFVKSKNPISGHNQARLTSGDPQNKFLVTKKISDTSSQSFSGSDPKICQKKFFYENAHISGTRRPTGLAQVSKRPLDQGLRA